MLALLGTIGTASAATKARPVPPPQKQSKRHGPPLRKPVNSYFSTPPDFLTTPAYRYGQLAQAACEAELKKRHIAFVRQSAAGVVAPVRLSGPLHGVLFRTELSDKERAVSPHEIGDCRLVLAMDDFTEILRRHNIVEVRHYSMYRLPPDNWPRHKPALHHLGAVAIDVGRLVAKDGSVFDVDRDFHGAIGALTCGPGAAPRPATPVAKELRAILCETVAQRIFNVVLTPNYNVPHKNHFHLEVTAGVKWFLVH